MDRTAFRDRALKELRHRAVGAGFRPGTLRGAPPSAIRARALTPPHVTAPELLAVGGLVVGAFFAGRAVARWWRGGARDRYLTGAALQSAH